MKKNILIALSLFLSVSTFASSGELERLDKQTVKAMTEDQMQARAIVLEERLVELQSIDFETLDKVDRKAVKSELRYINKESKALANGGVYISVGALLVIIIILLII